MAKIVKFTGDNDELFVKQCADDLNATAQVIVPETHYALIVRDGAVSEALSSGKHDIFDTENGLFRIKKDRDVSSVDLIFISKTVKLMMKWGTPQQLKLRDAVTDVPVSIGANGEMEVRVTIPKKFYLELVGSDETYSVDMLKKRILGKLINSMGPALIKVMKERNLSYLDFDEHKAEIGEHLEKELAPMFEKEYGLEICSFIVSSLVMSDADIIAVERQRSTLKAKGDLASVVCMNCGATIASSAQFCPECGAKQTERKCRKCGTTNPASAKFCYECGAKLKD